MGQYYVIKWTPIHDWDENKTPYLAFAWVGHDNGGWARPDYVAVADRHSAMSFTDKKLAFATTRLLYNGLRSDGKGWRVRKVTT